MKEEALDKQVTIEGSFVKDYKSITIKQHLHKHHSFEVVLDLETIEEEGSHTIEKSKDWLGKKFTTNVYGKAFVGIILDISLQHDEGGLHGVLILKGLSQTVLLETGKQQQSWADKDLASIVNDLLRGTEIRKQVAPIYTSSIPYQCQYLESNFAYLQRLAQQHNEWFYFNGVDLFFGKPKATNEDPIIIEYPSSASNIKINIQTYQPHINTYNYESLTDKVFEGDITGTHDGLNELANASLRASKNLYKDSKEIAPSDFYLQDKSSLDDYLKRRMQSITAQGNTLVIKSNIKTLRIGTIIKVNVAKWADKNYEVKKHGEYIITDITHYASTGGSYSNHFKAIPASVKNLPLNPNITEPITHNQIATVVNNADPEQKGRVQVQFHWQKALGLKTNWLRVMTPDAGKSHLTDTNRGFVFIPEKGDLVMVGFEYNDPNRPFIMGSMFSGKTGAGGGENNTTKSIVTRGGNVIELNDKAGNEKITIKDKDGSVIMLDTKKKSLYIQATEDIELEAKNIRLKAKENVEIQTENKTTIAAKADINILSQANATVQSDKDTSVISGGKASIEATTEASLKAQNISIKGQNETILKGQKAAIEGQMTIVKGAAGKLQVK